MTRLAVLLAAASLLSFLSLSLQAAEEVRFSRDVLPVLADRCFQCHGPDEDHREADLRLDLRESAVEVRDGYAVIVPGDVDKSELWQRLTTDDADLQMPPPDSQRKPLSSEEKAAIRRWIESGAPWGKHWSFELPRRAELPIDNVHPIDAFIRKRLEDRGLSPSPPAPKRALIRRVTLDLTGLPPTPEEVAEFLEDESQGAYERLVDRLLNSPHYGERMAWPWLDAARYADTGGYQGDPDRTMWPWRDWVVRAMNDNMPFDQFTIYQIAGDLLPEATIEHRLATGFNRNHMHNSEGGRIAEETRVENVFDRVETTSTVWLGLTMQCARCHDHKFDPLTNLDYFAFYDFFNQTTEDGRTDRSVAVPPSMEYVTPDAKQRFDELVKRREMLEAKLRALEEGSQDADTAASVAAEIRTQLAELAEQQRVAEAQSKPVKVMVMDSKEDRRTTRVLVKGMYNDVTDRHVTAAVPATLLASEQGDDQPATRLDLARWLVSPDNPLTARVTVNRYWQTFFGRGLVATPDDFGLQGAQPTHPDLLDWLAVEFMESGWDVKHLHRLIVTSATYRQSSQVTPELLEADASNLWLGRAPRYRMPSWMLRDQALAVSGLLSPTMGGPPVRPYQPSGIWAEATFGKKTYKLDSGRQLYRRSIYTFWRRIVGPTMFFDAAKRQTCEVKPNRTNTPLHALTTLNDVTYVEAARALAENVLQKQPDDQKRIQSIYLRLTSRAPDDRELELLTERLENYRQHFAQNVAEATVLLEVGKSERDETLDQVEHAALTTLVNTLMNLDEFLVKP